MMRKSGLLLGIFLVALAAGAWYTREYAIAAASRNQLAELASESTTALAKASVA